MIRKIVKLTNSQYEELLTNGFIMVDGERKELDTSGYTLYDCEATESWTELNNKIDIGLIKPNQLTHTQVILPKVRDMITEVEYMQEMPAQPEHEWNYVILKGKMSKGDSFHYQPQGQDDFGTVMIWDDAKWKRLMANYICSSDNEEIVLLKIYPNEVGYTKGLTATRDSFNMKIEELGLHTTTDLFNGLVVYNTSINCYDLFNTTENLYLYGSFDIHDLDYDTGITSIEFISGGINNINWEYGFCSLQFFKADFVNMITKLNAPNIRLILYDNVPSWIASNGFNGVKNLDIIPKAHTYYNNSLSNINRSTNKWIDIEFLHQCNFADSALSGIQANKVVFGKDTTFSGSGHMDNRKVKHIIIGSSLFGAGLFFGYNGDLANLEDLTFKNTIQRFSNNTPFDSKGSSIPHLYLEKDFNATNCRISSFTSLPAEDLLGIVDALKDNTGSDANTIYMGNTLKNKFINTNISYADDLGRYEFDTGEMRIRADGIKTTWRVTGRPDTLQRVVDLSSGGSDITNYTYSNGYITFDTPPVVNQLIGVIYTPNTSLTPAELASSKNWSIA